ncbi:MAG: hypothetical protein HGB05_01000 [Chloroflexi bacterium]|nr:hypothetical protein [Chloroflexota bacterium]
MPQLSDFIRLENTSTEPIVIGDTRITPQAQAFSVRFPFGGLVWNRPTAVLVERDDLTQRLPIVDVTRVAQIVLFGIVLTFSVIITLLAMRQRRTHHE